MKDGGSAFPVLDTTQADNIGSLACLDVGMTLRDYFAGQALVKVATATSLDVSTERIAAWCYKLADAMLAEKEKGEKKNA